MLSELRAETYLAILESLPTGVYAVDPDGRVLLWSHGAEELTGYLRQEVLGRPCHNDLIVECDSAGMFLLHKYGSRLPVTVHSVPLRDDRGSIIGSMQCFEKRLVCPIPDPLLRNLSLAGSVDALTGLPDRRATEARVRAYLGVYEREQVPFGVLAIALKSLDQMQHTDGRNAVEVALHATAQTLAACLGPADLIGRWSEEHMVAVVTGCSEPTLGKVAGWMTHLVELQQIPWWGDRLAVSLTIGAAVVEPGDCMESLVGRAEAELMVET